MRMIPDFRSLSLVFVVLAAFGCSRGGGGSSTSTGPTGAGGSGSAGEGTVTVMLTDSPFADAKAVLVTVSEVSIHRSGAGWESFAISSTTCDLKKLVSNNAILATAPLPAGHYTQIRLMVTGATLYFDNPSGGTACAPTIPVGASAPLEVPSGEIKLNREFDVSQGLTTTLTLDFDGDKSIRERGNGTFFMQPVIAVVSVS